MLNRVLRYLSVWLRPPRVASLEAKDGEVDLLALPFVSPVFVLSTGRCGTKWLTELLRHDPRMRVNHSDYPELIRHSRLAYERYAQSPLLFQEVLRAARDGYILDAHQRNLVYVETNNRITFFAHAIRAVYPRARFVHLIRHPGDFVRSGLRRGWYQGGRHDVGRIRDLSDPAAWEEKTDVAKIAWLWNETNQYIEDLALDEGTFLRVKMEELLGDVQMVETAVDFIGAAIDLRTIESMLTKKVNQQVLGAVPPYERWSGELKAQLRQHVSLAARYGYEV